MLKQVQHDENKLMPTKTKNSSTEHSRSAPSLRFPEFKGEWEQKKLEEVGEIITGLTYSPKDINPNGIMVLRSSNIKNGTLNLEDKVCVNTTNFNPVKENDILICVRNGSKNLIGKNALIKNGNEGLAFGAFMVVYRSSLNLFIYQLFATKKYYKIISENLGATINSINNNDLRKFEFHYPTLPEQQKIASFLTSVDERIQQLKQQKELLGRYKKGVMQKVFSQELRFKDDTSTSLSASKGKAFPDWEAKKLNEVAMKKSSNISANKIEDNFGDYIIYGASGVLKKIDFYAEENDYISIIKDGAGVGRIFYCKGKTSVLGTMEIIKPMKGINTYYLYCLLSNIDFVKYITGSTIPHIYFKDYSNEICGIPCLEEQIKIANFLSAIDDKITKVAVALETTELWKKGLLQKMFI